MSFSYELKNELANIVTEKSCCMKAELSGLLLAGGTLHLSANGVGIEYITENENIALKLDCLVKQLYGKALFIEKHERERTLHSFYFRCIIDDAEKARLILTDTGMLRQGGVIKSIFVRKSCCRSALIRGFYMGCGTMSDPEKSYLAEFVFPGESKARSLCNLLRSCGISCKYTKRKQYYVTYIKEGEQISTLLALMGASNSMLRFESIRVEKDVNNQVNRRLNCDNANLNKSILAGMNQREAIKFLIDGGHYNALTAELQEAAEARMDDTANTLQELADILGISKSGLNHRLKKIESIALELGYIPKEIS